MEDKEEGDLIAMVEAAGGRGICGEGGDDGR